VTAETYQFLAAGVLVVHLGWILWVILGVLFTRRRPVLGWLHVVSLFYSILIEVLPWPPCPLTVLEQFLETRAGIVPYHEPFLVHYLDRLVYPDIPVPLLVGCAIAVCLFNLSVYVVRLWQSR